MKCERHKICLITSLNTLHRYILKKNNTPLLFFCESTFMYLHYFMYLPNTTTTLLSKAKCLIAKKKRRRRKRSVRKNNYFSCSQWPYLSNTKQILGVNDHVYTGHQCRQQSEIRVLHYPSVPDSHPCRNGLQIMSSFHVARGQMTQIPGWNCWAT